VLVLSSTLITSQGKSILTWNPLLHYDSSYHINTNNHNMLASPLLRQNTRRKLSSKSSKSKSSKSSKNEIHIVDISEGKVGAYSVYIPKEEMSKSGKSSKSSKDVEYIYIETRNIKNSTGTNSTNSTTSNAIRSASQEIVSLNVRSSGSKIWIGAAIAGPIISALFC
jgi:hypothetical protein